ncbi:hypothetical protein MRB53_042363 [Persea americana]|nr:hypothetical protein MRB53_042363 [Persea americana]
MLNTLYPPLVPLTGQGSKRPGTTPAPAHPAPDADRAQGPARRLLQVHHRRRAARHARPRRPHGPGQEAWRQRRLGRSARDPSTATCAWPTRRLTIARPSPASSTLSCCRTAAVAVTALATAGSAGQARNGRKERKADSGISFNSRPSTSGSSARSDQPGQAQGQGQGAGPLQPIAQWQPPKALSRLERLAGEIRKLKKGRGRSPPEIIPSSKAGTGTGTGMDISDTDKENAPLPLSTPFALPSPNLADLDSRGRDRDWTAMYEAEARAQEKERSRAQSRSKTIRKLKSLGDLRPGSRASSRMGQRGDEVFDREEMKRQRLIYEAQAAQAAKAAKAERMRSEKVGEVVAVQEVGEGR